MLVQDLNKDECCGLLKRLGFGRLGCTNKNQPYVVPIYFAYEPDHLFGFSTAGKKNRVDAHQSSRLCTG